MNMTAMTIRTAKEAITAAGLNWKVSKRDVFFRGMDDLKEYADAKAIVRDDSDKVLGIVGGRYVPIQNEEVFSFLDTFVENDEVHYKSANQYNGGRVISVDLSLNRQSSHNIRVGDDIETIIRVITSHDGSQKLQARLLMNRLVCSNGMVRPHTCFAFSVKHTESAQIRIENGRELLSVAQVFGAEMAENARKMANTLVSSAATREYVNRVLGIKTGEERHTKTDNKRDIIIALGVRGIGNRGGTLWDAYNGVTEFADHHISTRGDSDRLTSSVLGAGLKLKERAYEVAQEFIAA